MLWQLFAEQPFSVRTEVVAHAPQSEGPILSGMGHAGTAEINDARQQAAAGQEIRQARIPGGEARERRKRGGRVQLGQNRDRKSTGGALGENRLVYPTLVDAWCRSMQTAG